MFWSTLTVIEMFVLKELFNEKWKFIGRQLLERGPTIVTNNYNNYIVQLCLNKCQQPSQQAC